jgi:parallel beta-helix repeat protein
LSVLWLFGCTGGGNPPPAFQTVTPVTDTAAGKRLYFVDGSLGVNPCPVYEPATRSCGNGRELAFNNLRDANGMARAGDTIEIRAGHYPDPLRPGSGGTPSAALTWRAYQKEAVVLSVAEEPALQLIRVQHVTISGLHIDQSLGWARLEEAHHNRIVGNTFTEAIARGTTGGLKVVRSHYNRIEDNRFFKGNDSIVIQDSNHNLILGNHLEFARHSLISIRCGNYNVIRGNWLHNMRQKAGEIYDCEGVSDAPVKYDVTKRNVWEFNHFAHVTGSSQPDNYNGIQYAAQAGVVRYNWFIDNQGGAIHLAIYPEEALYNYGNRIYGNRFLDNRCQAISAGNVPPLRANDNRIQGNVFANNRDCFGGPHRVAQHPVYSLVDNLEVGTDTTNLPVAWLTTTLSAGSGKAIPVEDVLPFYDGNNIPGEAGDLIELKSSGAQARIVRIDYAGKTLALGTDLQWSAGDGIRVISPGHSRPVPLVKFPPP